MAALPLGRIREQASDLDARICRTYIIPMIKSMMATASIPSTDFFQSILKSYLIKIVGMEKPQPHDWSRPEKGLRYEQNHCGGCEQLQRFVLDPDSQSQKISCKDPNHVKWKCRGDYMEYKEETSESIVVTKTLKAWKSRHKDWKYETSRARKAMDQLPQDELRRCLADEYDAVTNMDILKCHESVVAPNVGNESQSHEESESQGPSKRLRLD